MAKNKSKRRTNKPRRGPKQTFSLRPPPYRQQPVYKKMVRCDVAANAATQTVSAANLGSMLGVISTSATTSLFLSQNFRLKKVEMWSWTSTIGTTVDIELKWTDTTTAGGQAGPPQTVGDSSASVDRPAYVCLKPRKTTIWNDWQSVASTNTMLSYYSPQQAIMDLYFEWFVDDIGALTAGPALTGATTGTIYHHNIATLSAVGPINSVAISGLRLEKPERYRKAVYIENEHAVSH
jgi:hypothetical protein